MENTARKTHPMFIVAAIAVTVASLAAIAHFAGLLPEKSGPDSPSTVAAAQSAAKDAIPASEVTTPVVKAQKMQAANQRQPGPSAGNAIPTPPAGTPPPICRECGTVQAIRAVSTPGHGTGLGAVAGGVLGGLLGNQIGQGSGNTAATVVGAVGGALAGNQIERQARAEDHFEVTVRFADGNLRNFAQQGGTRWQVGDRVRLDNGRLAPN